MTDYYDRVKTYLEDLDYEIVFQDLKEQVFIVKNEQNGITNLVLGLANPILVVEQLIMELPQSSSSRSCSIHLQLLQKNRDIVHGAFVIDESGRRIIFRNTHELENLDLNELEATLNSLALLLSEYSEELIGFSK